MNLETKFSNLDFKPIKVDRKICKKHFRLFFYDDVKRLDIFYDDMHIRYAFMTICINDAFQIFSMTIQKTLRKCLRNIKYTSLRDCCVSLNLTELCLVPFQIFK